jgi:hypothetical protein
MAASLTGAIAPRVALRVAPGPAMRISRLPRSTGRAGGDAARFLLSAAMQRPDENVVKPRNG